MPQRRPFLAGFGVLISMVAFRYAYTLAVGALRGESLPLIFQSGSADFPAYTSQTQGLLVAGVWFAFGVLILLAAVDWLRKKPRRGTGY